MVARAGGWSRSEGQVTGELGKKREEKLRRQEYSQPLPCAGCLSTIPRSPSLAPKVCPSVVPRAGLAGSWQSVGLGVRQGAGRASGACAAPIPLALTGTLLSALESAHPGLKRVTWDKAHGHCD